MKKELSGRTALVSGASNGLGVDFARELPVRGADLVLVARSEDCLRDVAAPLERGVNIDILVNNAGFGLFGDFLEIDAAAERDMLNLDILGLTAMTRAINYELRGSGVTCTVLSPGVTRTSFLEAAGQKASLYQRRVMMESPAVARAGVRAMLRGKGKLVPGWFNKLTAFSTRLVPRGVAAALVWQLMMRG